jgi:hypothetical protein
MVPAAHGNLVGLRLHSPSPRLRAVDQRLAAAGTGAIMGLVLVVGLAVVARPPQPGGGAGAIPGVGAPIPSPMAADDLWARFERQGSAAVGGEAVTLVQEASGHIELPSGRLAIGDAFFYGIDSYAMARALPPGEHPVTVLEARSANALLPAAALIGTAHGVVRWREIPEARYAGSETAVVGLAPAELDALLLADLPAAEALAEALDGQLPSGADTWTIVESLDGMALYAISSEYGLSTAHWGLDAGGDPVAVLLDFGLLDG